jgi:hypothetical protein
MITARDADIISDRCHICSSLNLCGGAGTWPEADHRQKTGRQRAPAIKESRIHTFLSFSPGAVQTKLGWAIKGFVEFFLLTRTVVPRGTPVNIYLNKSFYVEYKSLFRNYINDSPPWHSQMSPGKKLSKGINHEFARFWPMAQRLPSRFKNQIGRFPHFPRPVQYQKKLATLATFDKGFHYNRAARRVANRKLATKCIRKSLRLNTVTCYQ